MKSSKFGNALYQTISIGKDYKKLGLIKRLFFKILKLMKIHSIKTTKEFEQNSS